jgi:glycosyltransferase involved in cell wall biosynthesis
MTVFFDCRYIRPGHMDGITRYTEQVFSALSHIRPITALVDSEDQLGGLPPGSNFLVVNSPTSIRELSLARRLNKAGASIVYSPMQTTSGLGRRYKLISTVHDLIYYRRRKPPSFLSLPVRIIWRLYHLSFWPQRLLLGQSDALVTVSESTKSDIELARLWPNVKPLRISSPAIDSTTFTSEPERATAGGEVMKTLVYAGSYMPYKGVETLVEALAHLADYELHLVSPATQDDERRLIQLAGNASSRLRFLGGLNDADYAQVLRRATAFVSASRDEGFGIPLIEAMACGTPVVCSDIPVFREVTGGSAEFFEPSNSKALAEAVNRLTAERVLTLRASGLKRASHFSWDASARVLSNLIDELAQET